MVSIAAIASILALAASLPVAAETSVTLDDALLENIPDTVTLPQPASPTIPNADSILNQLFNEFETNDRRLEALSVPEGMLWTDGMAIVEVHAIPGTTNEDLLAELATLGLEATGCFELAVDGTCSVKVPLSSLPDLAGSAIVGSVTSNVVKLDFQGAVNSFALESMGFEMGSDTVRTKFGVSGSGIKIGVLSDSFDFSSFASTDYADDIASGDLPPDVVVLQESPQAGIDEGKF
jgi:hypothetical protein